MSLLFSLSKLHGTFGCWHGYLAATQRSLVQVIAEHFYQQGNFRVGDAFVREAGIGNGDALKKPYIAMHSVLKEVRGPSDGSPLLELVSTSKIAC